MFSFRSWLKKFTAPKPYLKADKRQQRNFRPLRPFLETLEDRVTPSASAFDAALPTLVSDQLDYAPGATAILTASNFQIGETVQFRVGSDQPWVVIDGSLGDLDFAANGTIVTSWPVDFGGAGIDAMLTASASGNQGSLASTNFGNFENIIISGTKYYDVNTDGIKQPSEVGVAGFQITLTVGTVVHTTFTDASGNYFFGDLDNADGDNNMLTGSDLGPGSYTVNEILPLTSGYTIIASSGTDVGSLNFGNISLGAGGGKTLGFWSNKNGKATMNDGGTVASELTLLNNLNLVDALGNSAGYIYGTKGTPTNGLDTHDEFRSWILNANATNMAYMLSAQLAAMALNVEAGFVSGDAFVYDASTNSFVSITSLMAQANAALGADSYTPTGDPNRALQERLKNILDAANNNLNFVQATAQLPPSEPLIPS